MRRTTAERMAAIDPDLLEALVSAQAAIAAEVQVERVMAVVAAQAQRLTGATGAIVAVVESGEVVYGTGTGTAEIFTGRRIASASSLVGVCIQTREVVRCDDSESDPRANLVLCRELGARSLLLAPLKNGEQVLAVVKLISPAVGAFCAAATRVLELLAGFMGAALARAAAFEATSRRGLHDALTGLANRTLLMDRLEHAVAGARRTGNNVGVAFIDLDGFKPINDTLGHEVGDAVLIEVARRLERAVRGTDTVARVGGDEFVLVLPEIERPNDLDLIIERARVALAAPMLAAGHDVAIGASIGRAFCDGRTASITTALSTADAAMYTDKRTRRRKRRARNSRNSSSASGATKVPTEGQLPPG